MSSMESCNTNPWFLAQIRVSQEAGQNTKELISLFQTVPKTPFSELWFSIIVTSEMKLSNIILTAAVVDAQIDFSSG